MITSNHHALYIQIRAVSVLYLLSIKVPKAIATAKTRNNMDIKRVENSKLLSFCIVKEAKIGFQHAKIRPFYHFNALRWSL